MKTLKNNLFPIIIMLVVIAGAVFVLTTVPFYRVASGSMEPTLPVGTIVFDSSVGTLEPGDIITFQQPDMDRPTTHRFIGYADDGSLMTKGDANPTLDVHNMPLTQDEVLGKVRLMTPVLAPSFWASQRGLLIVALATAGILLLWYSSRGEDEDENEEAAQLEPALDDESRELNPV